LKIAYIGIKGLPSKGGAERVVEAIVRRLAAKHDLRVYCSKHYTAPEARIPGVKLIRLPCFTGKYTHMTSFDFLAAWHAVLHGDYDLIHLHCIEASFVLPILRSKYKVITTAHGRHNASPVMNRDGVPDKWGTIPTAIMNLMEIPYAVLSSAMTSVSETNASELSNRFHKPVRFIPNGVDREPDVDLEAARAILNRYKIEEGSYLFFATSRVLRSKGGLLLQQALEGLPTDYRLIMVGDQINGVSNTKNRNPNTRQESIYLPFIGDKATLMGLLKLSRLFIFPSSREAMSMMLLEAASVGVPIVCSDIPGNVAILADRALYFSNQDVEDLQKKISWAIGHPEEMAILGERAQAQVKQKFLWDGIVNQYDRLYEEVNSYA
jgi:glycosyltransferase involved in cell wall biosynthesis